MIKHFLLKLFVVVASVIVTASAASEFCDLPSLPTDMDLIAAVEATEAGEVHLHGMYRIGRDAFSPMRDAHLHELSLHYAEETNFRVAVMPHDAATLDVYLFASQCKDVTSTQRPVAAASTASASDDSEQHVFAILQAGSDYCMQVAYTLPPATADGPSCPKLMMELAVQPHAAAKRFTESCEEDEGAAPAIKPMTFSDQRLFEYDTTADRKNFWASSSTGGALGVVSKVVLKYPFSLPVMPGRTQRWKFWFSLQSRFLDSGDLMPVLTSGWDPTARAPPTQRQCFGRAQGPSDTAQNESASDLMCSFGVRAVKNHVLIQNELWSGTDYTLWLVLQNHNSDNKCLPYSFHMRVHPLPEGENFVSCGIDPLPPSLNVPGVYDEDTGIMAYSQDVLVNLSSRSQCTVFTPAKPHTMIRAAVGAHPTLDIDISLEQHTDNRFVRVASSTRLSGPDGVVYIARDTRPYRICVSVPRRERDYVPGSPHDLYEFCDSYDLRVDAFPLASSLNEECATASPSFIGLQAALDSTGSLVFGTADYTSFPFAHRTDISADFGATELAAFNFTLSGRASMEAIAVPHDPLTAPIVLELQQFRRVFSFLNITRYVAIAYGDPRTVGQVLAQELEAGDYQLKVRKAPVQHLRPQRSWDAWAKSVDPDAALPSCTRYNLRVSIHQKASCDGTGHLPLPTHIVPAKIGYRYVDEPFSVTDGSTHDLAIGAHPDDTLLHVLVSTADVGVTMTLITGGATVISSIDSSPGVAELFFRLKSATPYTLQFRFGWPKNLLRCPSMRLQLSLATAVTHEASTCQAAAKAGHTLTNTSIGTLPVLFDFGPLTVATAVTDADTDVMVRAVQFHTAASAMFRATVEFAFPDAILAAQLCHCEVIETDCATSERRVCEDATGYFNGVELASAALEAGSHAFVLTLYRRLGTPGAGTRAQDTQVPVWSCTPLFLQFSLRPVFASAAVAFSALQCPPMAQYLPKSLNTVAGVWPGYSDEAHLFFQLIVPAAHREDSTALRLYKPSIVRIQLPSASVRAFVSIYSTAEESAVPATSWAVAGGTPAYTLLSPGQYRITVTYPTKVSASAVGRCVTFPLELSIVPTTDLAKRSAPAAKCDDVALTTLPTAPFYHGHAIRYRKPTEGLSMTIPFSVSEAGGAVQFDLMFPFATGGLAATLKGPDSGNTLRWVSSLNRLYLDGVVVGGNYTLHISDPVPPKTYTSAASAACVPMSIHLRQIDYGSEQTTVPGPSPTGEELPLPPATGSDELACPSNHVDTIPREVALPSTDAGGSAPEVEVRGIHFPIPFGGSREESVGGDALVRVNSITIPISAERGYVVRAVVGAPRLGPQAIRLELLPPPADVEAVAGILEDNLPRDGGAPSAPASDAPLATSRVFGDSVTLTHNCQRSSHMRLRITFTGVAAPRFGIDFTTCAERQMLESFSMYIGLIPQTTVSSGTRCSSGQLAYTGRRFPVPALELYDHSAQASISSYLTQADRVAFRRTGQDHHRHAGGFEAPAQISFNVSLTVPLGTANVSLIAHTQYNMRWANMRVSLIRTYRDSHGALQELPPFVSRAGVPVTNADERYNAAVFLVTDLLPGGARLLSPGTYSLRFDVNMAQTWSRRRQFCMPYTIFIMAVAETYAPRPQTLPLPPPAGSTAAPVPTRAHGAPVVRDAAPRFLSNLDPSEDLAITLALSQRPATGAVSSRIARLVEQNPPHAASPHVIVALVTFADDEDGPSAVLHFKGLRWTTSYALQVNGAALGGTTPFDTSAVNGNGATLFSTGYCACNRQGFCVGGGVCGCTEANGESCSTCESGFDFSAPRMVPALGREAAYCTLPGMTLPGMESPAGPPPPHTNAGDIPNENTNAPPATKPPALTSPAPSTGSGRWARRITAACALSLLFVLCVAYWLQVLRGRDPEYARLASLPDGNPFDGEPTGPVRRRATENGSVAGTSMVRIAAAADTDPFDDDDDFGPNHPIAEARN